MEALIGGVRTYYIDTGVRPGFPVVLIHGMTFDHRMWIPQIELFRRYHRVIAYDLRGHGKSEVGDGQYTYSRFVDDLTGLLDFLEVESAVLCGLSMGGAIAIRACVYHPERVRALVACDTTCGPDADDSKKQRELAIKAIKKEGLGPFAGDFLKKVFAPSSFETNKEVIEEIRKTIVSSSPLGICGALLAQAARTDLCAGLSGIAVPTLFVVGAVDALTPPGVMEKMREQVPGARMAIIPSAGHVSNLENVGEFNRVVGDFLEEL